jgi:hypothetical protein
MALNQKIKSKIDEKTAQNKAVNDAIIKMLEAVDGGKQLKRVIEPILKTV